MTTKEQRYADRIGRFIKAGFSLDVAIGFAQTERYLADCLYVTSFAIIGRTREDYDNAALSV